MADQPPPPPPYPYPSQPPTEAGPLMTEPEPSKWPTVIGVIAIVFGAIGVLGGFCGMLSPRMVAMMPPDANTGADYVREWSGWIIFSSLVGLAFSGVLLAIGIGLLKRRFWSRAWAIRWSVVYMAFALVNLIFNFFMQQGQYEQMMQQNNMPTGAAQGMQVASGFAVCFGLVWAWALPIFLLIWMSREKIKAEIATWQTPEETFGGSQPLA